jgi:hypothetical protein
MDDQDREIARLKGELSMVQTEGAIASLTPGPTMPTGSQAPGMR